MNQDIRAIIRRADVKQWEVAKALGISEATFIRWLRGELSEEKRTMIIKAIGKVREVDARNNN